MEGQRKPVRAIRRLEPAAIAGVMSREVANFRTYWKGTTFSSILEPIVYLLAFGLGLGATLVNEVDGLATSSSSAPAWSPPPVIFSSALPAMFGTFVKHRFQNTYDAILAAPVDVEELVTAEMLWIGLRAGLLRLLPAAGRDGLRPRPAPGDAAGAALLLRHRARLRRVRDRGGGDRREDRPVQLRHGALHHAAVPGRRHLLPDQPAAPRASRSRPSFNPLYHLVELVRDASFGFEPTDLSASPGPARFRPRPLAPRGPPDDQAADRLVAPAPRGRLPGLGRSPLGELRTCAGPGLGLAFAFHARRSPVPAQSAARLVMGTPSPQINGAAANVRAAQPRCSKGFHCPDPPPR